MLSIVTAVVALLATAEAAKLYGCAGTCIGKAISATGCSSSNSNCICSSASFMETVQSCTTTDCSKEEGESGITLATAFCDSVMPSEPSMVLQPRGEHGPEGGFEHGGPPEHEFGPPEQDFGPPEQEKGGKESEKGKKPEKEPKKEPKKPEKEPKKKPEKEPKKKPEKEPKKPKEGEWHHPAPPPPQHPKHHEPAPPQHKKPHGWKPTKPVIPPPIQTVW